jgi:phage gp29-like protein
LGREIATTADGIDITRGFTGPLLMPYDSVLRARGANDLLIYEQVLSDPEVKATFSQRQLAVTKCEWQVDAGGTKRIDRQAADSLREQLNAVGWDNATTKMLYGVFYGYAPAELIYRPDNDRICIDAIKVRNRRRFRYTPKGELRLLTPSSMTEGVPAPAPYFWSFQTGADNDDEPYGLGLAHWLYWPVLFKRNNIRFWLMFLEKFGQPTAVGKYDTDASDPERAKLLAATRAIQTDSGIIMPKGMELQLLEAARSGTADYKALHDTMDAIIQKVVLGQTASTQGTPGKLGNDTLQSEVRADIIKADADLVCESFNIGPARWLTEWNFPGAAIPRVYRVTEASADLDKLAERDERLSRVGYKPTLARVLQVFGEGYEPVSAATPPAEALPPAAFAAGQPDATPIDTQTDALAAQAAPAWTAILDTITRLVETAPDLPALRDGLLAAYADLPVEQLGEVMQMALAAADLAGRYDVIQESARG